MHSVLFFDPIMIQAPRSKIYKRLGHRKNLTRLSPQQKAESEHFIDDALSIIHLKGAVLRVSIHIEDGSRVVLPDSRHFESRNLAGFLKDCREIILMGATAGSDIMNAIQEDISGRNMLRGVVFDATASEMADEALDWLMAYFNRSLRRENKKLLQKRFSAGYGDFSLENQKALQSLLHLDRLGVGVTESCMLIPEKSVTAITGIESMTE